MRMARHRGFLRVGGAGGRVGGTDGCVGGKRVGGADGRTAAQGPSRRHPGQLEAGPCEAGTDVLGSTVCLDTGLCDRLDLSRGRVGVTNVNIHTRSIE
jgi:hypothetical protein